MAIPILLQRTAVLLLSLAVTTPAVHLSGNLALDAPSVLSSTYGGMADHAVDGRKDGMFNAGSCTHTETETNPWWRVDLSRPYNITRVTITNRGDCCEQRINGAQIRIGHSLQNNGNDNTLAVVIQSIRRGETKSFRFNSVEGQYVNIFLPGKEKILTLCEVDVFAGDEENIALQRQATQSSIYSASGFSKYGVDGDRNPNYHEKGCAHTYQQNNPWFRVDLLARYEITRVTVTNRRDCCADRIQGAEIRIGDSLDNNGNTNTRAAVIQSIPAGASKTFDFKPIRGRYVNVVIPGNLKVLTLCEVEVYAVVEINIAPRGRATQSSLVLGEMSSFGHALNAIDGNPNPDQRKGTCSMTDRETDPWWRVDLHEKYRVSAVALTNPKSGSPKGLNGVHIRIGDSTNPKENPLCAKVTFVPLGETMRFECTEAMEGQYVTVILLGQERSLSLCEVEVFGSPVSTYQSSTNT
ncbi:uncharacterized protein LOC121707722 [Alosa sapidissima]|uniref:uncharacterized protein LOC121707722 n=1 Tax=Alosa sapidissima TaxID=34773 RepID=UPI001C0A328B|nr:uncharacterized protein LOC121707722 [Alosa sapidissima]